MASQPGSERTVADPGELSSTLRSLTLVVLALAGLTVIGSASATLKEVFRNLGGGVAAWVVCALTLVIGGAVAGAALLAWSARRKDQGGWLPTRKGEFVAMVLVFGLGGAFGSALGRGMDWRLEWSAGVYLESQCADWPEVHAWAGWALGVSVMFTVWAMAAQLLADRKRGRGSAV